MRPVGQSQPSLLVVASSLQLNMLEGLQPGVANGRYLYVVPNKGHPR